MLSLECQLIVDKELRTQSREDILLNSYLKPIGLDFEALKDY